jgi:hypothetical protein
MEQTDHFVPPSREVLDAEAEAFLAHPCFDKALIAFCDGMTNYHQQVRASHIGMPDTARWAVAVLILHLSSVAPKMATTATLIRICQAGGLCGPAAVKGAIGLLRGAEFIANGLPADDLRSRQLVPTARLIAMMQRGLAYRLNALSHVAPLPMPPAQWARAPGILSRFIGRNVEAYARSRFKLYDGFPEVAAFMDRSCGYLILLELLARVRTDDGTIRSQISPSDAAVRFGISRAHVRKLLAIGVSQGWLSTTGAGGQVHIMQTAHAKLRHWVALEFAWTRRLVSHGQDWAD